jgi:hypothetical protein
MDEKKSKLIIEMMGGNDGEEFVCNRSGAVNVNLCRGSKGKSHWDPEEEGEATDVKLEGQK